MKCLDKLAPAVCLHNMFSQEWTNDLEVNLGRNYLLAVMSGLGSKVMSIEFQWLISGSAGVCSGLGWGGVVRAEGGTCFDASQELC